jgi:threonine dehydratase
MFERLTPQAVRAAAKRIAPNIKRTPLVPSPKLSAIAGGDVYLKLEVEQFTGSFKLRGALNALGCLTPEQKRAGVVASSAGNHGMGVASAAKTLGIKAKVYVPRTAPQVKKDGIRAMGAELDDSASDYDAAMAIAIEDGKRTGRPFINPCLGDDLIAGQGTVALEIIEDLPALKSLVVNVGGGGLLGGCASLLRNERPEVKIYGAQSVNTAAMSLSMAAKKIVDIPSVPTLADGLAGVIDADGFEIGQRSLDKIVTLSEDEIAQAIGWLHREHKIRVEGAGACSSGAVLFKKIVPETPCAVVVSGGNIDVAKWEKILSSRV